MEQIIKIASESNSLSKLQKINKDLPKNFHEHTYILYDLRTLLGNKKITYMEIGSYIGSSASLIMQHSYPSNIICIDPLILDKSHYNGSVNQYDTLRLNLDKNNINNYNYSIYKEYSTSKTLIDKLKDIKVDLLFIDGDHRYNGVIADFKNYTNLVTKGGFIVFDDYLDEQYSPDVKKAVDNIVKTLDKNKYKIIGSIKNVQKGNPSDKRFAHLNEFIIQVL